ncbi:hypothetical protein XI05_07410 [Bradyrhizobium sp. CCBAU 11357]|nr:hypothetical protein [Bradyrhizobium sp. CCBAU 11357]
MVFDAKQNGLKQAPGLARMLRPFGAAQKIGARCIFLPIAAGRKEYSDQLYIIAAGSHWRA